MTVLLTQGCLVKSISFGEKIQSKLCPESVFVHSLLVLDGGWGVVYREATDTRGKGWERTFKMET